MFEQLMKEMETDALVTFKNGRSVYGIILDLMNGSSEIENLKFVPNYSLELYRATESSQLVIMLNKTSVSAVDICLK